MIYQIIKQYKKNIIFLTRIKNEVNRSSGVKNRYYTQKRVKAAVMPKSVASAFIHEITSKNMLGTVFDVASIGCLISKKDIKNVDKEINSVEINGKRYRIVNVEDVEEAFYLGLKETE